MATRSPRRTRPRRKPAKAIPPAKLEEIATRAARLGITAEKELQEYANIAFADLRHIVEWDDEGLHIKTSGTLTEAEAATIREIVGSEGKRPARIKLYDKKAALDAIAGHLGMFPPAPKPQQEDKPADDGEDPREVLKRRLKARLTAGIGQK